MKNGLLNRLVPSIKSILLFTLIIAGFATISYASDPAGLNDKEAADDGLIKVLILKDVDKVSIYKSKEGSADLKSEPGGAMSGDDDMFYKSLSFTTYKNYTTVNEVPYRGVIKVIATDNGLNVINIVPIDDYLAGLINNEISSHWAGDVVKAQAIIARGYALTQKKKRANEPFHLSATSLDQVYKGSGSEDRSARRAVNTTRGEVLTYNGEIALTLYHSNAGGMTESAANVWGGDYPYLKSVKSRYDKKAPRYEWTYAVSLNNLAKKLRAGGFEIDKVKSISIKKKSLSKRVMLLEVRGRPGAVELSGEGLRAILGYNNLRSSMFKVKKKKGNFIFMGKGSGHGVGLSQWGAKGMAEAGMSYKAILKHYYPGTKIEKYY